MGRGPDEPMEELLRPAVLIVDPVKARRSALAEGLAAHVYEVIPVADADEAVKFAQGLGPSVVVGPLSESALRDGSILDQSSGDDGSRMQRTLVLFGDEAEAPEDVPDDVYYLAAAGLGPDEVCQRLRLILVGREVGVAPDLGLRYLVGDVAMLPLLDMSRSLERCRVTAKVELAGGELLFDQGRPVAASFKKTAGPKAFCRLCRLEAAPFRIRLAAAATSIPEKAHNIDEDLATLALWVLEEAHLEIPDLRSRVRLVALKDIPSGELTPHERLLAGAIDRCDTVGDVLDTLSATDGLVIQALLKMVERGALRLERPETRVRVVTDSTADLPPAIAKSHGILVVPLTVQFGDDEFRDGVDIRARDFYQMLRDNEAHPTTQPPTEDVFYEHFHDIIEKQDILAVHISSELSLTFGNARKAALKGIRSFAHLPAERHNCALEVVDSRSISMGIGMQALFAARMALRGEKVFAIAQRLREISTRIHLLFGVDSLDYLVKGGRLGKTQAMVGKMLSIKPILGVVDGKVAAVDRARGGRRVHPRIIDLLKERVDVERPLIACVAHAEAPVWADRLRRLMERHFDVVEIFLADIGPVVGAHGGPGCVGVAAFQPSAEEWELIKPLED